MTVSLSGTEIARQITERFPEAVLKADTQAILVTNESILTVCEYLKSSPQLAFDYLSYITATDYYDYFEVVYHLTSMKHNHSLVLKTRCHDRDSAVVPSVVTVWRGADFQEREVYDLFGISFAGHPSLKRIMLWEGVQGHPLRKDYV